MDTTTFPISYFLLFKFLFFFTWCNIFVVHAITTTSICNQTPYPQLCNSLIMVTTTTAPQESSHFAICESAISAALASAMQAHDAILAMDVSSFGQRAKLARANCLELYEDSVYNLNRSISHDNPKSENDIQTWLSAALTNHQTCQNGFLEFNLSSHLNSFPFIASKHSKFVSNSLAIIKATSTTTFTVKNIKGRRLLNHDHDGDFPEWLIVADRKLLQAAVVPKADLVVSNDGSGDYLTISEAVAASAKRRSGTNRFVIYVKRGVYKENVEISRSMKNLMLVGDGIDATIITGSKNIQDGSTTFSTATFATSGEGFMAKDMTFENTAGPQKHQAVALRSGGDYSVFYGCSFKGYQDTLYTYSQRQFYRNCDIYGTIDFIFGDGVAVFQNCNIYLRKPLSDQFTTVTAQHRTDPNENTGIVIHNSRVMAASDLRPVQNSFKCYLGRPWGRYSRTVVMKSSIDGVISSQGWLAWSGDFALKTLYYGEYMNIGSGAGTGGRVKWPGYHVITSVEEAGQFSVGSFLNGNSWIPATGVPFISGL